NRGGFESEYMGSADSQPDGNVFVGWGSEPYFSEVDRSGRLVFEAELPSPDLSYRAPIKQWAGQPLTPPRGRRAARRVRRDRVRELERRHAARVVARA